MNSVSRNLAGLAVVGAVSVGCVPTPSYAADPQADTRHCVATRESRSGYLNDNPGRKVIEERWEVEGQGVRMLFPGMVAYPWCDRPEGSWVGVIFDKQDRARGIVWYDSVKDASS